jgi:hypothetical protein
LTWHPAVAGNGNGTGSSSERTDLIPFGDRIGLETASNLQGWFTACGVPSDLEIQILAQGRGEASHSERTLLEPGEIRRIDLRIPSGR